MVTIDFQRLNGESVLVTCTRDRKNPPVAMRGSLEVHDDPAHPSRPIVKLVIDFPDMFNALAHQRTLVLTDAELKRLVPAGRGGWEFATDQDFS